VTATIDEGRPELVETPLVVTAPLATVEAAAVETPDLDTPDLEMPDLEMPDLETPGPETPGVETSVAETPNDARPAGTAEPQAPPRQRSGSDRPHNVETTSRGKRLVSRLRTFVVVCVLLAAAALGGLQIIRERLAARAFIDLSGVVLIADAVPVGSAESVVVTSVAITQHARVAAGQDLATLTSATGVQQILRAPVAGTVAAVKVGGGGVARGGEPIIVLYDQARLTFQADVPMEAILRMRLGMTTYIEGSGLARRITATLDHVVPVIDAGQSSVTDKLTVVLTPTNADRTTVSSLVPGLRFHAEVDTNTATGALPAVNTG
jgi:HlyD family secretion protein